MKLVVRGRRLDVRPTLADRVVSYFDPQRGVSRLRARASLAASGYDGGRRDKRNLRNWRRKEQSADNDTLPDLPDLRARSRDLRRNTPIATGALATTITNVVGEGLQLMASVDHEYLGLSPAQGEELKRQLQREWAHFCGSCDFTRVQHGNEMQALVFGATLESGDVFVVRRFRMDAGDLYGTKLQIVEADRCSNPGRAGDTERLLGGVELDAGGVPVAYHFSDRHPFGAIGGGPVRWERVPARTAKGKQAVVHLFDRKRPGQSRGVPYLAPVVEELKTLSDYAEAEVTAALVSAMFTVFITSAADQTLTPIAGERDATGGLDDNEVKLQAGAVVGLAPGEKAESANPGRPNAQFDPFVQAILRQVGVALELPYELLIKHFTASYSASRAALEMAWQFFRKQRGWLARRYCQVVYEWFVEEAVALGRINAPGFFADPLIRQAYCKARWLGPGRPSIDQVKDASADEMNIRMRVTNREEVRAERFGDRGDWQSCNDQLEREEKMIPAKPDPAPGGRAAPPASTPAGSDDDSETLPQRNSA